MEWKQNLKTGEDNMTNNIPGIGINSGTVNPYGSQPKGNESKPEDKPEVINAPPQGPQVKPDDVLSYMANSAIIINPQVTAPKTYDIGRYVTPEQAERIAGFIASFEGSVAEGLAAITAELGENAPLSEEAKLELAAKMV